ncbi:unnamed protein product, partial [Effrenium voratum]
EPGVSAAAQERLKEESDSLRSSFDRLLAAYTSAAASLGTSKGTGLARPELEIMERRVENLQELNSKMKAQVRLQHEAMRKMVRFVSVHDDVIDKSLEGIVRFGWDGLRWKRGYTMLHYCAECVEEPAVVELVGLLATDVDRKDDNGMRPIDYARQSGREDIIKMLEHVRKISRKMAQTAADLKSTKEGKDPKVDQADQVDQVDRKSTEKTSDTETGTAKELTKDLSQARARASRVSQAQIAPAPQ